MLVLMSEQIASSQAVPRIAPLDGTYREVLALLERARALALSAQAAPTPGLRSAAAADLSPLARLEASCEALRVTSRLAHCLAWVLIHKAIHAGELSPRSEEHTSELQSLMRTSYAVFCLKKK